MNSEHFSTSSTFVLLYCVCRRKVEALWSRRNVAAFVIIVVVVAVVVVGVVVVVIFVAIVVVVAVFVVRYPRYPFKTGGTELGPRHRK